MEIIIKNIKIFILTHFLFSTLLTIDTVLYSQGLPTSGNTKILVIYSDVKDSSTFSFNPHELSSKLKNFYDQMSLGKLNLDITNLIINIDEPQKFSSHLEAIVFLLEQAESELDLTEFSQYADKNILDGICIIIDDFYNSWDKNPDWSGIATIDLKEFNRTFDNMSIQKRTKYDKSSGLVMRSPNDIKYSFWVLAHEVGHLLGLNHFPEKKQLPYYQLMNCSGTYWGINRGMSFWEREQLGWIQPTTKGDVRHQINSTDSISFYLNDYMSTGEYAKIVLPGNDRLQNGNVITEGGDVIYFENRMKTSEFDQDKYGGDEGIFIWNGPGKLIAADDIYDFSTYPTRDAFGAPNFYAMQYRFNTRYYKMDNVTLNEGYYQREYLMPVNIKFAKDNKTTIIYGPAKVVDYKFIITAKNKDNKILLDNNYPNPFNPTTKIGFRLYIWGRIQLEVFDIVGQKVATLADKILSPGNYSYTFDASQLSSGIYTYRIIMPTETWNKPHYEIHSKKMLYIK